MIYLNDVPLRPFFVNSASDEAHEHPEPIYEDDGTDILSEDDEVPED